MRLISQEGNICTWSERIEMEPLRLTGRYIKNCTGGHALREQSMYRLRRISVADQGEIGLALELDPAQEKRTYGQGCY